MAHQLELIVLLHGTCWPMPSHLEVVGRLPMNSYQIWSCRGNMLAWTIVAAFSLELPDGLVKATIPAVLLARARSLLLAKGVGKSCLGSIAQKSGAHDVCVCGGGKFCQYICQSASSGIVQEFSTHLTLTSSPCVVCTMWCQSSDAVLL